MQRSKRRLDQEQVEVSQKKLQKAYLASDEVDSRQPGPSSTDKNSKSYNFLLPWPIYSID